MKGVTGDDEWYEDGDMKKCILFPVQSNFFGSSLHIYSGPLKKPSLRRGAGLNMGIRKGRETQVHPHSHFLNHFFLISYQYGILPNRKTLVQHACKDTVADDTGLDARVIQVSYYIFHLYSLGLDCIVGPQPLHNSQHQMQGTICTISTFLIALLIILCIK